MYLSGICEQAYSFIYERLGVFPQALHRLLSWKYVIIVRADKNRDTAGRKDIEFYLFYEYIALYILYSTPYLPK